MAIKPEILKSWGPGGWSFYQPETDWHAPLPLSNSFNQQVKNIAAMRLANPRFNLPTDEPTVAADLEAFTEARWSKTYSRHGMVKFLAGPVEPKKKESSSMQPFKRTLSAAVGLVGIDVSSLEEWLGAGAVPVAQDLANRRAEICATCTTGNQKAGWRGLLTIPGEMALRRYIEGKNKLKLATPLDSELGSCTACHCVLELKVWQPAIFIKDNTEPEVFESHRKANPNCWVLAETK
jgi:hypothetical protein